MIWYTIHIYIHITSIMVSHCVIQPYTPAIGLQPSLSATARNDSAQISLRHPLLHMLGAGMWTVICARGNLEVCRFMFCDKRLFGYSQVDLFETQFWKLWCFHNFHICLLFLFILLAQRVATWNGWEDNLPCCIDLYWFLDGFGWSWMVHTVTVYINLPLWICSSIRCCRFDS